MEYILLNTSRIIKSGIRNYGSTYNVGMSQVKNGHLYLRYGSSSENTRQSEPKHLQTIIKNALRVLLPHSEAEKSKPEIFDFVVLLSSSSHVTQKPYGAYEYSTCQTNALLLNRCLFWVRTVCEPQLVCYYPKHTSWSLSETPFCVSFWP